MNKKISIIAGALLVLAAIYWLSTVTPPNDNTPTETVENANVETGAEITVTPKGPLGVASGNDGQYLVDKGGLTLYVKNSDAAQNTTQIKTSCNAECEKTWLPYLMGDTDPGIEASTDAVLSKVNVFDRADGKKQYALGNQPLYRYVGDSKLGDMNGPVDQDWMVAKP